jgi:sugar (pentulose or hexulose) kinase
MPPDCFIGVDVGTSGCRVLAIDADAGVLARAEAALPPPRRVGAHGVEQDPWLWWRALRRVLRDLAARLRRHRPAALCLDGTSATVLLAAPDGNPLGPALMYNDARSRAEADRVARQAPGDAPARGPTSSLAKCLHLSARVNPPSGSLVLHQADWLLGRLTGRFGVSDWNNALKLGYDPARECWPGWLSGLGLELIRLPRVFPPGTPVAGLSPESARATGLPDGMRVAAGTTDSTAAVLATGIRRQGDAVTCLGSSLVLKILAPGPVTSPPHGVYSHRFGGLWLVGGASNSGGAVLRRFFTDAQMAELSRRLRPEQPSGLDYYPLPAPGERFPVSSPDLAPRLTPRPEDDLRFFQGLLEGIAAIEAEGYRLLHALGAPAPTRVLTIGGGAGNQGWERIRQRLLGVAVTAARHRDAAYGSALLALASSRGSDAAPYRHPCSFGASPPGVAAQR